MQAGCCLNGDVSDFRERLIVALGRLGETKEDLQALKVESYSTVNALLDDIGGFRSLKMTCCSDGLEGFSLGGISYV